MLKLNLLGGLSISQDPGVVTKLPKKSQALLCYLAQTQRPRFREDLADLLWGELSEENARVNLRMALTQLRKAVPDHLMITQQTVAFNPEAPYWCDVEAFETQLKAAEGDSEKLKAVMDRYNGDFLEGFSLNDAPRFEDWLLGRREHFQQLFVQVLHDLSIQCARRGEYEAGINYAARLLELEPWQERAHRQMMILLVRSGQRSAALAQFKKCRKILTREFNVDVTQETQRLYDQIRNAPSIVPHNLPRQPTPFVGRKRELAQLVLQLEQPDCRLLSLVGLGGIGKTRLALALAERKMNCFLDGVFFVTISSHTSSEILICETAKVVGFSLLQAQDPKTELFRHLADKNLLLILDGFEHTPETASVLSELLQHTDQLKLLVTSTVPLQLRWEWRHDVEGFEIPVNSSEEAFAANDQVQLFLAIIRRVKPFELSSQNRPLVARICQLVEGIPLALELVGMQLHNMSLKKLIRKIEDNVTPLTTSAQDVLPRHRSLMAVFDVSWERLSSRERLLFSRLSVFRGGFEPNAAKAVCLGEGLDVNEMLESLQALVIHFLVKVEGEGKQTRYWLLDPVRQYARTKISGEAKNVVLKDAHLRHFLALAEQSEPNKSNDRRFWTQQLEREKHNLKAAFQWALDSRQVELAFRLYLGCNWFMASNYPLGRKKWSNELVDKDRRLDP